MGKLVKRRRTEEQPDSCSATPSKIETKTKERKKKAKKTLKKKKKGLGPEISFGSYFFGFQSKNTHPRVKILRCKK